jgi:hypothetical protein
MDIDMKTVFPSKYMEKLKAVANHKEDKIVIEDNIQNFKDNGKEIHSFIEILG